MLRISLCARFMLVTLVLGAISLALISHFRLNYPHIRSDGVGYYLYLPASFIHKDLTLRKFAEKLRAGRIPEWTGARLWENTDRYLIKYPVGQAILTVPFFLMGWLASYSLNFPMNGFSLPFQVAVASAGLFYAIAGLTVLWKTLERDFDSKTVCFSMIAMVYGTNLFHYATYDNMVSHIYSFFLFSVYLLFVQRLYEKGGRIDSIALGLIAGLITVTRPTNALWLTIGIFYGIDSAAALKDRAISLTKRGPLLALSATAFIVAIAPQLVYWKLVTGRFLVYSYGDEGFNFLAPHILHVLFSPRKGLFFWSPVVLVALVGLPFLRKHAPEYFTPFVIFLPLNVFVISSWYCWWYGASFGHRAFTESMPLFALCLCSLMKEVRRSATVYWSISILTAIFTLYSLWQMIRLWIGVFEGDGMTLERFLSTFFRLS